MPDDPEAMKLFESELDRLIMVGKKQGLSFPKILYCILNRLSEMVYQCSTEMWFERRE